MELRKGTCADRGVLHDRHVNAAGVSSSASATYRRAVRASLSVVAGA
jgi:hypothetical protein